MRILLGIIAGVLISIPNALAQVSPIQMSILPNGRSGGINEPVTYFATILSSSQEDLTCAPRFGGFLNGIPAGTSAQSRFYAWDGTTITDAANTDVVIPAGGRQDYVVSITIDRAFSGPLSVVFRCQNAGGDIFDLPRLPFVNDFHIRISDGGQPDILVIADTLSRDGVARVGATGPRAALMTVAAINIGEAAPNVVVRTEITGFSLLDNTLQTRICETDAAGVCLGPQTEELQVSNWAANETRFFAVRTPIPAEINVPFFPDILRQAVIFDDSPVANTPPGLSAPTMYKTPGVYIADVALFAASVAEVEETIPVFIGYQCRTRPDNDSSAAFERAGGIILMDPPQADAPEQRGYGYIMDSLLDPIASVTQPFEIYITAPPAESQGVSRPLNGGGRFVVLGGNEDDVPQTADVETPVTINTPFGGLIIHHNGSAGTEGFFLAPGRIRCSALPASLGQPLNSTGTASVQGEFTADSGIFGTTEVVVNVNGRLISREEDRDYFSLDNPPAENVAKAFHLFFSAIAGRRTEGNGEVDYLQSVDPGERTGFLMPLNFRPGEAGGSMAACMVLMTSGFVDPPDGETDQSDAGVFVLTRDGAVLSDEERELCLP